MRWPRAGTALVALTALAIPAGCGGEAAEPSGPAVTQRVTRDFGRELLAADPRVPLAGHRNVLRLLEGNREVVRDREGVIQAIDGVRQRPYPFSETSTAWIFNVNGIEADEAPADYELYPGDVVQWDLRDVESTLDVRATVGAFPETFTRGVYGERFPTAVRCERPASRPCRRVRDALRAAGVPLAREVPDGERPPRGQPQQARIFVGRWGHWRDRPSPHLIDEGPRYSGVFASFDRDASRIRLYDWNARPVRAIGAGSGLVAAVRPTEEFLTWFVTGVDDAGVARAARALDRPTLRDAFAMVVDADGPTPIPLPPRLPTHHPRNG